MDVKHSAAVIPLPVARIGNKAAILNLVRDQVDIKLDYILSGFADNIARTLFAEMTQSEDDATRRRYFNIMRAMRVGNEMFTSRFNQLINDAWMAFPDPVDEDLLEPMDEEVAASMAPLCQRVATHYKIGIRETRYRLQSVCERELETDPLDPDLYYRCFWHAIQGMALQEDERHALMSLFHRFVMDRYGQILNAVNRTLIELRVERADQFPTSNQ